MTNEEILTKAVKKAISGGWIFEDSKIALATKYNLPEIVIFNHDFAKALWGESLATIAQHQARAELSGWQYHLQQMVIADDPIKYLGENI